jgi:hypothetical protein
MSYFFILPAFALYVVALCSLLVVTLLYRPAAPWRARVLSALIGSVLGFVLSTLAYAALVALTLSTIDPKGRTTSVAGALGLGALVFLVPVIVAVVGVAGGTALGLWLGWPKVAGRGAGSHQVSAELPTATPRPARVSASMTAEASEAPAPSSSPESTPIPETEPRARD